MSTSTTGVDSAYNTMIVQLGVSAKDVETRNNIQRQSVNGLDAERNAQAGVNTDEEMTNMVEFQKAYEASAKFIATRSPIDIGQSLSLRASLARSDQLADNITDAEGWLGTTDTTLGQIVTQLRQSLLGFANSQYGNRPLFGAPGVQVQVNVNGDAVFGTGANDLFSTLDQIATAVQGNQSLEALERAAEDADARSCRPRRRTIGATYARVDTTKNQNTTNASTMTQNLTNVENVDLAEVLMNLQAQETTYQAALAAAAKAIQPSLAAFLQ